MSKLFDEVRKLADLENGILPDGTITNPWDVPEFMLTNSSIAVEKAGKADIQGVWDILRNGTEEEFSALVSHVPEIGGEFDKDDNSREVMRIAKQRLAKTHNHEVLLANIKAGFGVLFNQFWDEAKPAESVGKARTFKQAAGQPPI